MHPVRRRWNPSRVLPRIEPGIERRDVRRHPCSRTADRGLRSARRAGTTPPRATSSLARLTRCSDSSHDYRPRDQAMMLVPWPSRPGGVLQPSGVRELASGRCDGSWASLAAPSEQSGHRSGRPGRPRRRRAPERTTLHGDLGRSLGIGEGPARAAEARSRARLRPGTETPGWSSSARGSSRRCCTPAPTISVSMTDVDLTGLIPGTTSSWLYAEADGLRLYHRTVKWTACARAGSDGGGLPGDPSDIPPHREVAEGCQSSSRSSPRRPRGILREIRRWRRCRGESGARSDAGAGLTC